ncbi:thioredoxin [Angustibacter aerolatus]
MATRSITDDTFDTEVLQSDKPVLVDFWAPWCHPCKAMAPILDEIAGEHAEIDVVKINTDDHPKAAARYGVTGLPTLNVYVKGELVKSITGAKPKPVMIRELADFLG